MQQVVDRSIDLSQPFAPVTIEVPYEPVQTTQLNVQIEQKFQPITLDVHLQEQEKEISRTGLEMTLKRPSEFVPVTVEFPYSSTQGQPAVFLEPLPQTVTVEEGTPVKMVTKMAGEPRPEVIWLKNGQPIHASDNVSTSVEVFWCLL